MKPWKSLPLALVLCGPALHAAPPPSGKPNVILILADDLGYGDIGPFGNTEFKTPNLDRMAREGRKFTSFYATPVCSMSRACLLTGAYNVRVSVPGVLFPRNANGLHPDEITLAEVAKSQGYATACVGKWHLGHLDPFLPTRQGFDAYFGIPYSNDMTIDSKNARFAKGCVFREGMDEESARASETRHKVPLMRGEEIIEYPADQNTLTQRYTAESIQFIRANRDKPFFLYLPHTMVHVPLAASTAFRNRSGHGLFGDAVEELDWSTGEISKTLKELDLDSKTLVIFTSDNGADTGSSKPWRGKKGSTYEGGVREPCIMRWPGHIPAGSECQQIAGNIDVLPTLASLFGGTAPTDRPLDGRDISTLLMETDPQPVRDTQIHFSRASEPAAIRQGNWKLHVLAPVPKAAQPGFQPELYDLEADPSESINVAAQHPDRVKQLSDELKKRADEIRQNRRNAPSR
jgi:arylsulfatase A